MSKFYSASTGGFYDLAIHGGNIPPDAVEITDAQHAALLEAQSQGQRIEVDVTGLPVAAVPVPTAAELQAEKDAALAQARDIREQILNRLSGILLSYLAAGDTSHNAAIEAARQGLLNMPADPRVVAATDGATTKAAVMLVYGEIAAALQAADPASVSAFNGMSL